MRALTFGGSVLAALLVATATATAPAGATGTLSIDTASLYGGGHPCAVAAPLPIENASTNVLQAAGTGSTGGVSGYTFTFQVWPVSSPSTVTTITASSFAATALATVYVPSAALADGMTYSWRVEVGDGSVTSPWSPTCGFRYDTTPPPAPQVTSNYPSDGTSAPVGQLARFTFTGGGSPDVAGFLYTWGDLLPVLICSYNGPLGQLVCPDVLSQPNVVKANAPGGSATVALSPPGAGPQDLTVSAIDLAGNVSEPPVRYSTFVPATYPTVTVRGSQAICGSTATVTFSPYKGVTGVKAYAYATSLGGPTTTVSARRDGTATVQVPVASGLVTVSSISKNGFVSTTAPEFFDVDPQPSVQADVYVNSGQPVGGVGVPGTFTFSPPSDGNNVSAYSYRFNDGPLLKVSADPNTQNASVVWAPRHSGTQTLTVRSVNADLPGTSCTYSYSFIVAAR